MSARRKRKLPKLTSLILHLSKIPQSNKASETLETLFKKALACIETLSLTGVDEEQYQTVALAVSMGRLPNLRHLRVSLGHDQNSDGTASYNDTDDADDDDAELNVLTFPSLTHLTLNGFVTSQLHLLAVAIGAESSSVTELDISHSSGLTRNLSELMSRSFPSLHTLNLGNCGLNPKDLRSLAKDISDNERIAGELRNLFTNGERWNKLLTLVVRQYVDSPEDFKCLVNPVLSGALRELQKLVLLTNGSGFCVPKLLEREMAKS